MVRDERSNVESSDDDSGEATGAKRDERRNLAVDFLAQFRTFLVRPDLSVVDRGVEVPLARADLFGLALGVEVVEARADLFVLVRGVQDVWCRRMCALT